VTRAGSMAFYCDPRTLQAESSRQWPQHGRGALEIHKSRWKVCDKGMAHSLCALFCLPHACYCAVHARLRWDGAGVLLRLQSSRALFSPRHLTKLPRDLDGNMRVGLAAQGSLGGHAAWTILGLPALVGRSTVSQSARLVAMRACCLLHFRTQLHAHAQPCNNQVVAVANSNWPQAGLHAADTAT
jgi:hypothetical protein